MEKKPQELNRCCKDCERGQAADPRITALSFDCSHSCHTPPRPESAEWEKEWLKRGYRIVPTESADLDLDHEGEHNAKRDGKWTITIIKEEADLLISSLLSRTRSEAVKEERERCVFLVRNFPWNDKKEKLLKAIQNKDH